MNWMLVVVTTVQIAAGQVETRSTETLFKTADQCSVALAKVQLKKDGVRTAHCQRSHAYLEQTR